MRMWEILNEMGGEERVRAAFVGAGGKTSCILALARTLAFREHPALVCTSTHMESPDRLGIFGLVGKERKEIQEALKEHQWLLAGEPSPESGKIRELPVEVFQDLEREVPCILIEADGSRKLPVKVPRKGEPVIPKETTHIFILAGAAAFGKPLSQVCQRREEAEKLLKNIKSEEEPLLTPGLLCLLMENGYVQPLRKAYPGVKIALILNQSEKLEQADRVLNFLQKELSVPVYLHSRREETEVCGIFLAAGFSRRFGENKLLYPIGGKAMYLHGAERLQQLAREKIFQSFTVVTQYPEIQKEMEKRGISCVENTRSERGIASSLRLGLLKEIRRGAACGKERYYMFFTADQPFLKKSTIEEFLERFLDSRKGIGCMAQKGEAKNPVIFREEYVPQLLKLEGDRGGKQVVKKNSEDVFLYEVPPLELKDFDCPEDFSDNGDA